MLNPVVTKVAVPALPNTLFTDVASYQDFAAERARYEIAIRTFAREASPAGCAEYVKTMGRVGIKTTLTAAREAAVSNLTVELRDLGYDWNEIEWHASRRGRRDRMTYTNAGSLH